MESFEIIEVSEEEASDRKGPLESKESNPLEILKKRFATGEITEEDYHRMKRILQE
jgi:uncharacterized membrane protein